MHNFVASSSKKQNVKENFLHEKYSEQRIHWKLHFKASRTMWSMHPCKATLITSLATFSIRLFFSCTLHHPCVWTFQKMLFFAYAFWCRKWVKKRLFTRFDAVTNDFRLTGYLFHFVTHTPRVHTSYFHAQIHVQAPFYFYSKTRENKKFLRRGCTFYQVQSTSEPGFIHSTPTLRCSKQERGTKIKRKNEKW